MEWFEGRRYAAWFRAEGLHRRWNWCSTEREGDPAAEPGMIYYECAFIVYPDGGGTYFDFQDVKIGEEKHAYSNVRCRKLRRS